MRARVPAVVLLALLTGPMAGCFGILQGGEDAGERTLGLAEDGAPEDATPEEPSEEETNESAAEKEARARLRVEVNASWSVGDQWYYESNRSQWRRVTVENLSYVNGTPYFRVHTATGLYGYGPEHNAWETVNAITYNTTVLRHESAHGITIERTYLAGGDPRLRFLHNGTYGFDEEGRSEGPSFSEEWRFRYVVNVRPQRAWNETVLGESCEVVWFKEYVSRWDPEKPRETLVTGLRDRVYCAALQNDVYFLEGQELWTLRGYRVGDAEAGKGLKDPRRG